ncbi:general secretion pathway protein GspB [Aliiglaciecola sp. LCG003]|uniref:general secretion pathway protein GspB n=1 Tax=Aliiglaciecola sp. LCG003 TaxID=3053655 RepID=UPI002573211E|nr:general secretion pathway protein GspB [Aliiglaciecola sp. LCG003]WJG08618.1 general secretion pathway protein GspB [Aliiglaciecola sp. LCG003]
MTQKIPIDQLKVGMVIIKVTAQNGPVKIKKSGLVNSQDMIKALSEMGVQEVEVDPDMTVEVKKPKIAKSKTLQLLEDTGGFNQSLDQDISEQFNRSLFLPSVQELPEAWQYYGKKAGLVALVVLGGFCIGWVIASLSSWTQLVEINLANTPAQTQTTQKSSAAAVVTTAQDQQLHTQNPADTEDLASAMDAMPKALEMVESNNNQLAPQPIEQQPITRPKPAETSEIAEPESKIPEELLKKFQDAMESLDQETGKNVAVETKPIKDVPTVEELPAWVLTQLPNMSFSAHMYASSPDERWVRVNGKRVFEGQKIDAELTLVTIEPQHVIITFKGQEFSMDALTDW